METVDRRTYFGLLRSIADDHQMNRQIGGQARQGVEQAQDALLHRDAPDDADNQFVGGQSPLGAQDFGRDRRLAKGGGVGSVVNRHDFVSGEAFADKHAANRFRERDDPVVQEAR